MSSNIDTRQCMHIGWLIILTEGFSIQGNSYNAVQ